MNTCAVLNNLLTYLQIQVFSWSGTLVFYFTLDRYYLFLLRPSSTSLQRLCIYSAEFWFTYKMFQNRGDSSYSLILVLENKVKTLALTVSSSFYLHRITKFLFVSREWHQERFSYVHTCFHASFNLQSRLITLEFQRYMCKLWCFKMLSNLPELNASFSLFLPQ